MILDVVVNMVVSVVKKKRILPLVIMVAAFIAVRYWKINIVFIILACGIFGAVDTFLRGKGAAKA